VGSQCPNAGLCRLCVLFLNAVICTQTSPHCHLETTFIKIPGKPVHTTPCVHNMRAIVPSPTHQSRAFPPRAPAKGAPLHKGRTGPEKNQRLNSLSKGGPGKYISIISSISKTHQETAQKIKSQYSTGGPQKHLLCKRQLVKQKKPSKNHSFFGNNS